ncbi:MAG: hypothetical protein JO257_10025 [Deltaproteobacteria bacterium]|nr:hypothetical protein [Deltaproteobacteria bacterium]
MSMNAGRRYRRALIIAMSVCATAACKKKKADDTGAGSADMAGSASSGSAWTGTYTQVGINSVVVFDHVDLSQTGVSAVRVGVNEFRFSLGLTSPVHLLTYHHEDRLPNYCRRDAILDRIKKLAEDAGCTEKSVDLGSAPTRLITCKLQRDGGSGAAACPVEYVAQIWQERRPNSTEDYRLEMYARVRDVCAPDEFETFQASAGATSAAEQQSDAVMTLLRPCAAVGSANGASGSN